MQKKVIAIAVAGALAAPAVAMAQSTSTVQVYGYLYVEYGFTSSDAAVNGSDPANVDILQTGSGSHIGFRGEEKLGGNLSAWFQCESSADVRGVSAFGFCTRNSAVGLKGRFGNVFVGIWDTPFKRTIGSLGSRDTDIFGSAFLLGTTSTSVTDGASAGIFKRRQRNSINYDSPVFGGFQVLGAFSSTNSSTATTATSAGAKPRIWSVAASFKRAGFDLSAAYEKHTKAYPNVAQPGNATFAGDEDGYQLTAAYTLGPVKFGGTFTEQEADTAPGANSKVKVWILGAEWKIAGPHNLHGSYVVADDIKGTVGSTIGGAANLRPAATGLNNTGADLWQIRYVYNFSKRTNGAIGYVRLSNDSAAAYSLGGLTTAAAAGGTKQSAIAASIEHRF